MEIFKSLALAVLFLIVSCNETITEKKTKTNETDAATATVENSEDGITNTLIVAANADNVWTLLRELDNIDEYSSAVASVEWTGDKGVGGQRVCTAPDGKSTFKENIVAFDDQHRTYSYAVVEGVPAKNMVNTFKVVNLGYQKSAIVWSSTYDTFMENPQMSEAQFLAFVNQSSNEMIANVGKAVR